MTKTLQVPPTNRPFLNRDGTVDSAWRAFLSALLERTGGYAGELITAGNGIAVSVGPTVSIDPADSVGWTADQTFTRAIVTRLTLKPAVANVPVNIGDVEIAAPSNVQLKFYLKGTDGVVRTATLALA